MNPCLIEQALIEMRPFFAHKGVQLRGCFIWFFALLRNSSTILLCVTMSILNYMLLIFNIVNSAGLALLSMGWHLLQSAFRMSVKSLKDTVSIDTLL